MKITRKNGEEIIRLSHVGKPGYLFMTVEEDAYACLDVAAQYGAHCKCFSFRIQNIVNIPIVTEIIPIKKAEATFYT
jgi:hypothetical protein